MSRVGVVALVASLVLAGCGGGGGGGDGVGGPGGEGRQFVAGRSDINATDPAELRQGGELRWPYDGVPATFNFYQTGGQTDTTEAITGALIPTVFVDTADGGRRLDTDYVTAAEVTTAVPQTITYTINPAATWSDGTPITWRDFEAQWRALNGGNPAFQAISPEGYDDIVSVTRGVDDKQAVVTLNDPFGPWQTLFSPLYPASTTGDPTTFNTGWLQKVPVSAGPFRLEALDPVAGVVTLARDPAWWGPAPKLDRIIYKPYDTTLGAEGVAMHAIDFYPIGYRAELAQRSQASPDVEIRQSVERSYRKLLFNGAPGTPLADLRLRVAVGQAIDRAAIAKRVAGGVAPGIVPTGNHFYPLGSTSYQDNSAALPYDPAAAGADLDALGWTLQGDRRVRDGQPLTLRMVVEAGNPVSEQIGQAVAEQLGQVGVTVTLQPLPGPAESLALAQGDFDLIELGVGLSSAPLQDASPLHAQPVGGDVAQNYGRIYDPSITDLFSEALDELDDTQRAEIGNQIDSLVWTVVHSMPLFPDPGVYAVRPTLANFGAFGLADIDYTAVGYVE